MASPRYKRVVLKISGEALMGDQEFGMQHEACAHIANSVKEVCDLGLEVGIVVGGGNIFRGRQAKEFGFEQTPADHIGMLGTMINGLILQQSLAGVGVESQVMSAINCALIAESYKWAHAMHALQKGRVVIFVGGTSNPYFTTDTAAALRASEVRAEILLKGTKVDGVYDSDPMINGGAKKYSTLSFSEALAKDLKVMDGTALALLRENKLPVYVFDLFKKGALKEAVLEGKAGSLVTGD
ncbi:MAG: UMP kinase [Simkaniaceae bacterium]|nr:UMP kinase [Candidatus Sacchlamyda saccharinae]